MNTHNHFFTVGVALLLALVSVGFAQQTDARDTSQVGGQAHTQAHTQIQNPAALLGVSLDLTPIQQEGGAESGGAESGGAMSGGAMSGGASGGSSQEQADIVVDMKDVQFQPNAITIQAGQTIEFINKDSFEHTVYVFTENGEDIYPDTRVASGDSVFVTIDQADTYQLECTIHPGMIGTITVN